MKATDRSILLGLVILGLLACFWFLLLSPKREEAAELSDKANGLRDEVAQQEQLATAAEEARQDYSSMYRRLVVLGKAAPADGDTPSLLVQFTAMAERSDTVFGSLMLGGEGDIAAAPPPVQQTTTDQNAAEGTPASETAAIPAPPTEASAATLPLGATVGPAGLGVLPYSLQFEGDFFATADLLSRFDRQVTTTGKGTKVDGRLITVNGFSMTPGEGRKLLVDLSISTFVLPGSQGLTAGATPSAPPATVPEATATPIATEAAP